MASNSKRKWADYVEEENEERFKDNSGYLDDESEPHKFGKSVFPVANLPDSFDGVPEDGMQYLFTVRREEKQLPLVTRVPNPYAAQGSQVQSAVVDTGGSETLPSREWRTCFEERFRALRVNSKQPTICVSLPSSSLPKASELPAMRDRDRWWAFFRGDREWQDVPSSQFHGNNTGKKVRKGKSVMEYDEDTFPAGEKMCGYVVYDENLSWDQEDEGEHTDGDGDITNGEKDGFTATISTSVSQDNCNSFTTNTLCPREPTPHLLSLLDQKTTFHLLKYFTQWVQGHFDRSFLPPPPPLLYPLPNREECLYNFTLTHARWIFALLSHLDAQLSSDEISILRRLAREIIRIIREERHLSGQLQSPLAIREKACWMIVAAITGVWGQQDLWTDAAAALR